MRGIILLLTKPEKLFPTTWLGGGFQASDAVLPTFRVYLSVPSLHGKQSLEDATRYVLPKRQ